MIGVQTKWELKIPQKYIYITNRWNIIVERHETPYKNALATFQSIN